MTGTLPGRFYPVVDSADWVRRMAGVGARLIQLRIKTTDSPAVRSQIRDARAACNDHGACLVLNDHWRAALDEGIDFIHLGQEDLDDADLPAIRRAGLRLGVSTHSDGELDRALSIAPDYIALGPVWPTTLKQMPWAPQGLQRLGSWKARLGAIPLVAIGGITLERAPSCIQAGADAVAVVSDVIASRDPEARALDWIRDLGDIAGATSG